ncbi:HIT domain-containing protein [Candidatus Babeliales bacterium]|nr:HIT domain-containing protein [Candidatus Babeliales bacterium]
MEKIYAPWRHDYVSKTVYAKEKKNLKNECVFCHQFEEKKDREYLIIKRYEHCALVMNKYPYNAGHLMVLPLAHKAELCDLDPKVRAEIFEVVNIGIQILKKIFKPDGFNVGINIGQAGGGGIPTHLHIHILPRWNADTNFLATIGDTKVICTDFMEVYDKLIEELT